MTTSNLKSFKCIPGHEELTDAFNIQINLENEYNKYGVSVKPNDVVLDLGANVGIFTQYALDRGASDVYSYECDDEILYYFLQNITSEKVALRQGYVGGEIGYKLSDILLDHNLSKVDFVKCDIEGSEFEFFEKMDDEDMIKVDRWVIEFHTLYHMDVISDKQKAEKLMRLLHIFEKFTLNGYNIYYEHPRKEWDAVMLYASKTFLYDIHNRG